MTLPLRLTRDIMTWAGTPYAVSDLQRPGKGQLTFTVTPEGFSPARVEIDIHAGTFTIDGIVHGLRGWRKVGEREVEAETVDPVGPDYMEVGE